MKHVSTFILVTLLTTALSFSKSAAASDWELVWFDEFSGPAQQSPSPAKWDYDIGTDWGNAQLEYDTDRPENVSLDGNGHLAITAREESYLGQPYTSARIVTRDLYEVTYGRIEARIKLPVGQGIWPAFWMLGRDITTVGWPQCGEIDIMEYRGQEPDVVFGSLHGPGYFGGAAISQIYQLPSGDFNDDYYVFAVEWEEDALRWYVDDVHYQTVFPEDLNGNDWVFDHPFYLILNVAVGGNFVGSPDASTVFPQTMLVDYVRVYQRTGSTQTSCCVGRAGDMNSDGVNADPIDLSFFVDFLFSGGVGVLCEDEADINGDGTVADPIDLSMLVDFLFAGGLLPEECPVPPVYVFEDAYGIGVTYQAFAGSKVDGVQIDPAAAYNSSEGLAVTVPDAGDPSGSYVGGAFTSDGPYDLSGFNALTFRVKASVPATLDVIGVGNDNTGTSKYTAETNDISLTTDWQQVVLPLPQPDKLQAEDGLFHLAEGPENDNGYEIWIDDIVFETRSDITNPRASILTETKDVLVGAILDVGNGEVTFDVAGTDRTLSIMPAYLDFDSSNDAVVSVSPDGTIRAESMGSAVLTAQLGDVSATGAITVNVTVPPGEPGSAAPTPTYPAGDVISLFSDEYTNVTVDTWSASWDVADVEDHFIGLNATKKYTSLVFAGIEFTSSTIDAATMTHLRMDVWTPDPTALPAEFKIKLVDFGADGVFGGAGSDDVEHELAFNANSTPALVSGNWISFDIPLSNFVGLTTRGHLAQLLISGDPSTVFVDNVLLHR